MEAGLPCLSLDGMQRDDESPASELPDGAAMETDALDRVLIGELLNELGTLEREVINRRYFADRTQRETGEALGLTQVQVSRIESRAIRRLRSAAAERRE